MKNENTRNTIIFIVCSVLILGIYWFTVLRPQAERRAAQQSAQAEQSQTAENAALAPIEVCAIPPRMWPSQALAPSNRSSASLVQRGPP